MISKAYLFLDLWLIWIFYDDVFGSHDKFSANKYFGDPKITTNVHIQWISWVL